MGPVKIIRRRSATSLLCPILGSRLTLNGCYMVSLIERFVNGLFDLKGFVKSKSCFDKSKSKC
jgi:hypothetical protein